MAKENGEGNLYQLHWSEGERRVAVGKLIMVMKLWTDMGEWLDELVVLREAVVSVREVVADKRLEMGLDTVKPATEEDSEESEGSAEMDLEE